MGTIQSQGQRELWAEALDYRRRYHGVIGVASKVPIRDRSVLSLVYTPGVAEPFQPCKFGPEASFGSYPEELTPVVRNAYLNAIHECDRQLGRTYASWRVRVGLAQVFSKR